MRGAWLGSVAALAAAALVAAGANTAPGRAVQPAAATLSKYNVARFFLPTAAHPRRSLQDGTNDTDGTTASWVESTATGCVAEIPLDAVQCQIDYMAADCDGKNIFSWNTLTKGAVALHIFGILIMFISLSIVCDEFFVPGARCPARPHVLHLRVSLTQAARLLAALEALIRRWNVDPDIAGATFMAAGGSAPELFTSFIGTFQRSAVGFGTIGGMRDCLILFTI
eukprot:SAG31_NODE_3426_length_4289_cov_14.374702_2_plen_225_part_00